VLLSLASACRRDGSAERAGDDAYAAGRYAVATERYAGLADQMAESRVLVKLAHAAQRAGELEVALRAWRRVGEQDPSLREEAADGVERALRAAERAGGTAVIEEARAALVALMPERPVPADAGDGATPDRGELEVRMAQAGEPQEVDSLLVAYAGLAELDGDCAEAVGAYRAVVRRGDPERSARGREGVALCASELGGAALEQGRHGEAVALLREALAADPTIAGDSALARLARALAAQGDSGLAPNMDGSASAAERAVP
jgi:tetratricopeptide (TPR) repeat protein